MLILHFMKMCVSFLLLFSFLACQRKDFFQAPDEVMPYVEKFVIAGEKRGISIHPEKGGLFIEFDTLANHQLGRSKPNVYPKVITLNQRIWQDLDTFQRRALLFHELGHCLLLRKHRNELLPRGECLSLLVGKEANFQCSQNLYSELWWEYYMDELFKPEIDKSNWYEYSLLKYKQDFQKEFLMKAKNPTFQLDTALQIDGLDKLYKNTIGKIGGWFFFEVDTTRNYQIEVTYQIKEDDYATYRLSWNDLNFITTSTYLKITALRANNKQSKWGVSTNFYEQKLLQNATLKKLTIRKVDELLYFFFNEKIIHLVEANYPKGKGSWIASQVDKSTLRTNLIYENKATLEIEVAYLK